MAQLEPVLAITMGDPAGIGPEIIAKVVYSGAVKGCGRLVCFGDGDTMRRAMSEFGGGLPIRSINCMEQARPEEGGLDVFDLHNTSPDSIARGTVQAAAGAAAYEYVTKAIDLGLSGAVSAIVTAPINKEAMNLAGLHYNGHTEILAERTGATDVTMMLASGHFRVTHVSTHVALSEAVERCRAKRIQAVIRLTDSGLRMMGINEPRLAVASLNPHSGEGGYFGREEISEIQPAIDAAIRAGYRVHPIPLPPDSVFVRMREGYEFDAVVAQYHDQGHIPAKLFDFWGGVNITLGLPIVRTSVDHGTAFDIAGQGRANPASLINAIRYASKMSRSKQAIASEHQDRSPTGAGGNWGEGLSGDSR